MVVAAAEECSCGSKEWLVVVAAAEELEAIVDEELSVEIRTQYTCTCRYDN